MGLSGQCNRVVCSDRGESYSACLTSCVFFYWRSSLILASDPLPLLRLTGFHLARFAATVRRDTRDLRWDRDLCRIQPRYEANQERTIELTISHSLRLELESFKASSPGRLPNSASLRRPASWVDRLMVP